MIKHIKKHASTFIFLGFSLVFQATALAGYIQDFRYYKEKTYELLPILGIDTAHISLMEFIDNHEETGMHTEPTLQERQRHPNTIFLNLGLLNSIESRYFGDEFAIFECAVEAQLSQVSFAYEPRLFKHKENNCITSETLFLRAKRLDAELTVIQKLLLNKKTELLALYGWLWVNDQHGPYKGYNSYPEPAHYHPFQVYSSHLSATNKDILFITYDHCKNLIEEWGKKHPKEYKNITSLPLSLLRCDYY